jgi:hypothetical protein
MPLLPIITLVAYSRDNFFRDHQSQNPLPLDPVVLECAWSHASRVHPSDTDRAYAFSVTILVVSAVICYLFHAGLIDKVVNIPR